MQTCILRLVSLTSIMAGMVNREVSGDVDGVPEEGAGDPEACGQSYESFDYLPPIQRLEKYALTQLYQRNLVGRVILETLKSVADDPHEVASVFRILYNMSDNADPEIRTELMDHVPHIAMLCHSEKEKLLYVVDHLLPLVAKELSDPNAEVRKAAQITLLVLMDQSLVGQSAVEEVVCPVVNMLSNPDQYPASAVQLMSKMAPFLGRESTEKFFLARFCDLCHRSSTCVRKMCAAYFGEFCAVVWQPTTEEILLSRFVDLCQDDAPGVRKACAEVIMSVSCACTLQRRKTVLAPLFVSLLRDSVRWVRSSAFKTLGPFISTFAVPSVADLVYNENGELVLVNREGCEFRLNPNSDRTADMDAEEEKYEERSMLNDMQQFLNRSSKDVENEDEDWDDGDKSNINQDASGENTSVFSVNSESEKEESVEEVRMEEASNSIQDDEKCEETLLGEDCEGKASDQLDVPSVSGEVEIQFETLTDNHLVDSSKSLSEPQDPSLITEEGPLQSFFESLNAKRNSSANQSSTQGIDLDVNWEKFEPNDKHFAQGHEGSDTSQDKDFNSSFSISTPTEEWDFNSFQFWKVPIPEISISDLEISNRDASEVSLPENFKNEVESTVPNGEISPSEPGISYRKRGRIHRIRNDSLKDRFHIAGYKRMDKARLEEKKFLEERERRTQEQELTQDIVPQALVELFVSMTDPPHDHMTDFEIALHCAFSLPAVALTLGRENWIILSRTCKKLAGDRQWKVRRTVACSIHELAVILGEDLTAKDLVPIYNGLIKDLDEVRIGALKHLADFVKLLPTAERKSFLTQFDMFLVTDTEWNWRFREELAQQLLKIIPLYSPQETCTHLVPVAICLLSDKVAAVRSVALVLVTGLINHVTADGPLLRKLLPQLAQEFANSTRWERRQAFALLCSHLVSGRVLGGDQFAREVLPYLLDLSYDRVPNVRLAVARTLASDIMAHQFFSSEQSPHQEVLMQVLKRLSNDKDRDVRYFAKFMLS